MLLQYDEVEYGLFCCHDSTERVNEEDPPPDCPPPQVLQAAIASPTPDPDEFELSNPHVMVTDVELHKNMQFARIYVVVRSDKVQEKKRVLRELQKCTKYADEADVCFLLLLLNDLSSIIASTFAIKPSSGMFACCWPGTFSFDSPPRCNFDLMRTLSLRSGWMRYWKGSS